MARLELEDNFKSIQAPIELHVRDETDRARNQALAIFGFIAIVFGALNYFGLQGFVSAAVDQKMKEEGSDRLDDLVLKAKSKVDEINAINTALATKGIVLVSANKCPAGWKHWDHAAGQFLRGFDERAVVDPDGTKRELGEVQEFSTALPNSGWSVSEKGEHTHKITGSYSNGSGGNRSARRGNGDANPNEYNDDNGVSKAGEHTHEMAGGDIETRPTNISVLFCKRI